MVEPTVTVYLGLGANLGDRLGTLRAALHALADRIALGAVSPVFETEAVAGEPQPRYLNLAVRAETALGPRALLEACLAIEATLGRVRPAGLIRAPRTIDVDLLLHGGQVLNEPGLTVPHPALLERAFVRVPLAAVAAAGLRHPITGDALDRAQPDATVRPFAPPPDHRGTRR